MPNTFDVIIVGGSAAGLSAALTLGRSLRNVLVIDACTPCNRQSPRSHNFITHDGAMPADIVAAAKRQILEYYTVAFLEDTVIRAEKINDLFNVETETGKLFQSSKILLATGLSDITPDISGFAECWGISILHCPYCHGYEVKALDTAILANGEAAYNTGLLIYNWSKKITILTNGISQLRHEERERLEALGISILESEIDSIRHTNGSIDTIAFTNGEHIKVDAMYATIPYKQQSTLAEILGCKMTEKGHIEVDAVHHTTVDGVYAAGDNTAEHRAISVAAASGTVAGFTINADLTLK